MTTPQPLTLAGARSRLIRLAALTLAIYAIFVIAFPLGPNVLRDGGGPASDLEMLMRPFRWFAPLYVLGVIALYVLFWRAMRLAVRLAKESPKEAMRLRGLALGAGIVCGLVLLWLYPISAIDVLGYVVRGRLWAVYGSSPLVTPPDAFPEDPYTGFAGEYADRLSPYGPIWEIAAQIPLRLGALGMVSGVIGMKLLVLAVYVACAVLIGWGNLWEETRVRGHSTPLMALLFFAWNPLILMQGVGNGHNDLLMIAFMLLAVVLRQRGRWAGAILAATLAALVKLPGLFLVPIILIAILRDARTWQERALKGLGSTLIFVGAVLAAYSVAGPLPEVFGGIAREATARGYAPASAVRMVVREVIPRALGARLPSTMARNLFVVHYAYLILRLWNGRLEVAPAAFRAYFWLVFLAPAFHIWYPLWIIPFAALRLTSLTYWRTWLFGLTAELSIVNYFVVWRWLLGRWSWGLEGPLAPYWLSLIHI